MSIQELIDVVPPPANPRETGSPEAWKVIQEQLGMSLPDDYRDFGMYYGTGLFDDGGLLVRIPNPFSPGYLELLEYDCEMLRLTRGCAEPGEFPYDIYPERPGLFPLGNDDNGALLVWLTEGPPERWPILIDPVRYLMGTERWDLPMTTFLARVFSKQLEPKIWSGPEFFSGPRAKFVRDESELRR